MVVQLDGPLGHAQQRIFKVVSELAEGAPLEGLWRSGSKRGASDRRFRAARSYVQLAKLLVEPRQAMYNHQLGLHGL